MNSNKLTQALFSLIALTCFTTTVFADELMMARSTEDFPETMLMLQNLIKKQGYTPSRVQRVDIGLTKSGYKTDKYRVVFFGETNEIKKISAQLPELVPYLPLKISIFAEEGQTILVTIDPMSFDKMYPNSKLTSIFKKWKSDVQAIFNKIQNLD